MFKRGIGMSERKLATIRVIDAIDPIEGADKIVCATIGGWKLVTAIDNGFSVGDLVVYLEIDSWVPTELASFLSKGKEPREFNGVKGERLRTIKLRGQVSQGLLLPTSVVTGEDATAYELTEGQDVTEALGIQKWERPMNAQLAGMARGNFPSFIRKTDQERIQNLSRELVKYVEAGYTFEETEKLEGSSMTVYSNEGDFGVCSRNLDLKETEGNAFWATANKLMLREVLNETGRNLAIQGELIGPGIQGNIYGLSEPSFRVFDIFDIDAQEYVTPAERNALCFEYALIEAPLLGTLTIATVPTMTGLLARAEGKSKLANCEREGVVYKCVENPGISFKAISNSYLLKHD